MECPWKTKVNCWCASTLTGKDVGLQTCTQFLSGGAAWCGGPFDVTRGIHTYHLGADQTISAYSSAQWKVDDARRRRFRRRVVYPPRRRRMRRRLPECKYGTWSCWPCESVAYGEIQRSTGRPTKEKRARIRVNNYCERRRYPGAIDHRYDDPKWRKGKMPETVSLEVEPPSNKCASCPRDCMWGPYEEWSSICSALRCGKHDLTRTRTIDKAPAFGGTCPPATKRTPGGPYEDITTSFCDRGPCKCEWKPWSDWGACDVSCGIGERKRAREKTIYEPTDYGECIVKNWKTLEGEYINLNASNALDHMPYWDKTRNYEIEHCNTQKCPRDCRWEEWKEWTECSASCSTAAFPARRYAYRDKYAEINGGAPCVGSDKREQSCNPLMCPIDCAWSNWASSPCSVTCGGGVLTRTRFEQTVAQFGGGACWGPTNLQEPCNEESCDATCLWDAWSVWSTCTRSCGGGIRNRVAVPKPNPALGTRPPTDHPTPLPTAVDLSCQCYPCGSSQPSFQGTKRYCGPTSASCSASAGVESDGCYTMKSFGCDCFTGLKQGPTPKPTPRPTPKPTVVTCSCTTPNAGTVNLNQYQCTNGETRYCGHTEKCSSLTAFPVADVHKVCVAVPATPRPTPKPTVVTCACTTPWAGAAGHNQFKCDDGSVAYCGANYACTSKSFRKGHHWAICKEAYVIGYRHTNNCPAGTVIVMDENECIFQAQAVIGKPYGGSNCWRGVGCLDNGEKVWWSSCKQSALPHHAPVCKPVPAGCQDKWADAGWGNSPLERCREWSVNRDWGALKGGATFPENCQTNWAKENCALTCGCLKGVSLLEEDASTADATKADSPSADPAQAMILAEVNSTSDPLKNCNWECYLNRYNDLAILGWSHAQARNHYIHHGQMDGRTCECEAPSWIEPDPARDGKICGAAGSTDRAFELLLTNANEAACHKECLDKPYCVGYTAIFGAWCIGCRVHPRDHFAGTTAFKAVHVTTIQWPLKVEDANVACLPKNGGELVESQHCNTAPCAQDCVWGQWSEWASCSQSCGGGIEARQRKKLVWEANGGICLGGWHRHTRECNAQPCPFDCKLSAWTPWTTCDRTCEGGFATRSRTVLDQPRFGGRNCVGELQGILVCNTDVPCPKKCAWEEWEQWGDCSKSCGPDGRHVRERFGRRSLYPKIAKDRVCQQREELGTVGDSGECEERVQASGGLYFSFERDKMKGKCYLEDASSGACTTTAIGYDLYALRGITREDAWTCVTAKRIKDTGTKAINVDGEVHSANDMGSNCSSFGFFTPEDCQDYCSRYSLANRVYFSNTLENTPSTSEGCNWMCYLARYKDLSQAGYTWQLAREHYRNYGKAEGRDCTCEGSSVQPVKTCEYTNGNKYDGANAGETWIGDNSDGHWPTLGGNVPRLVKGSDRAFAKECMAICMASPNCDQWSFGLERPGIGGICYFYRPDATLLPGMPMYTGGKCEATTPLNQDLYTERGLVQDEGPEVGGGTGYSLSDCKNACDYTAACMSFTYFAAGKGCYMKAKVVKATDPGGNTPGRKTYYKADAVGSTLPKEACGKAGRCLCFPESETSAEVQGEDTDVVCTKNDEAWEIPRPAPQSSAMHSAWRIQIPIICEADGLDAAQARWACDMSERKVFISSCVLPLDINFTMPRATAVDMLEIIGDRSEVGRYPKKFKLYAKQNQTAPWQEVFVENDARDSSQERGEARDVNNRRILYGAPRGKYLYYQLSIFEATGSTSCINLAEVHFYEKPSAKCETDVWREVQECNTEWRCPADCTWSPWGTMGECSVSCGGGIQARRRQVLLPATAGGTCKGSLVRSAK
eukprot:TRINITY_DN2333_c0_g1_i2.p1 TRINITY_DN2333_c0_g1~~TRINITY_DN2333_c0_g1_i2.p1  ORF type:complete len:2087 (-),score=269.44 TRINITY_DN2333_c0_g1_i2:244-5694(-)